MSATTSSRASFKAVALPAEHGGWGFLFEPIALGLLVAPSLAGLLLGIAVFNLFLLRNPLKVVITDRRRGRRYARTALAERVALGYALLGIVGIVLAVTLSDIDILLPMALAVPFVMIQLAYDARNKGRALLPELAGPTALAAVGGSIVLAGGWSRGAALVLSGIVAARAIPSVLYVRSRLRLEFEKPTNIIIPIVAHAVAVIAVIALAMIDEAPVLAVVMMIILMARAAHGLSIYRRPSPPKVIGFQELGLGMLMVVLVAIGYSFGI
ncbi:MAG: prenyltransferase [Chloroflexi bacterium]|nr:MAG: prenyltransferase [Chloroflexota bacterium]